MRKKRPKATKIMVIRHGEKPGKDGEPYGVTQKGKRSKESLQVRGWQRAGALAQLLAHGSDHSPRAALASPQFLFASKPLPRKGSRRSIETITPLAEKLALTINSTYQRNQYARMIEQAAACNGVVLICWQQEYIPQIASRILGKEDVAPSDWPDSRFDMIWVFDLDRSTGRYRFKQVPQRLLNDDSEKPIK